MEADFLTYGKMIGRAFTAQCVPGDNLALHQAIYAADPGEVLILDLHGLAGVVIDGSCRDSEDIKELGFPVFARAFNPSGTVKESLAKMGVPVRCGGVEVRPGDIVFGDCDGVVVIPQEQEDVLFNFFYCNILSHKI